MKILLRNNDLNEALFGFSNIGFVPTMGSLHEGHVSLIKKSMRYCNKTIVSIFVNPTQFNNKNDYNRYPKNIKKDLKILRKLKVDFVYIPSKNQIYNSKNPIKILLSKKDKILCAKHRKGHFEGVIDVMTRLTKIIEPSKIFMGEKDFQQLYLIKKYIKNKYKVISCKTIRDNQKLALSSRNDRLDHIGLKTARSISKDISNFKKILKKEKNIQKILSVKRKELSIFKNVEIEYLELRNKFTLKKTKKFKDSKIFIAYHINDIRLIDNF